MDRAGLETMLMNYYRHIDRSKVQFDFLTHRQGAGDYDEKILAMGGKIYRAPRLYPQNYGRYFAYMQNFFKGHPEYRIIHSHIDAMSFFPLLAAKQMGLPVRIAHSHSGSLEKDFKWPIKMMAKRLLPSVATDFFACGGNAARFLFGERIFTSGKYTVVKNAVEAKRFSFSSQKRGEKRRELGVADSFVIGHVGRFAYPKNHEFLIEVFSEIQKEKPDSVLLLAGDGPLKEQIRRKTDGLGLTDSVRFLGVRPDVPELLQAFDVFVMPSRYEGLPLVGVEAQAADLPCFFSDAISRETQILNTCRFLSLDDPPSRWAQEICSLNLTPRRNRENELVRSGFNIDEQAEKLEEFYVKKYREIGYFENRDVGE